MTGTLRVGLISDTHGLLRPQALAVLRGADHIIHAGDIGAPEILDALGDIARLTAVRGNNDTGHWAHAVPMTADIELGGVTIHVLHELANLGQKTGARVVVSGHSHKPLIREKAGVLFVNPGSAGPRRFKLPVAVAELRIFHGAVQARIRELVLDR